MHITFRMVAGPGAVEEEMKTDEGTQGMLIFSETFYFKKGKTVKASKEKCP